MLTLLTLAAASSIPDPGNGTAPPGSAKLLTILQWTAWGVFALCVGGVLIGAVKLFHAHQTGGVGSQQQTAIVWTLVACVIAGSASGIVGALA